MPPLLLILGLSGTKGEDKEISEHPWGMAVDFTECEGIKLSSVCPLPSCQGTEAAEDETSFKYFHSSGYEQPQGWDFTAPRRGWNTPQNTQSEKGFAVRLWCWKHSGREEDEEGQGLLGFTKRFLGHATSARPGMIPSPCTVSWGNAQCSENSSKYSIYICRLFRRNTFDYRGFHILKVTQLISSEKNWKEIKQKESKHLLPRSYEEFLTSGRDFAMVCFQQLQFFCLTHWWRNKSKINKCCPRAFKENNTSAASFTFKAFQRKKTLLPM